MVQSRALPALDGQLMSQSDEFELQQGASAYPEQEQGTGDKSVTMPMAVWLRQKKRYTCWVFGVLSKDK